MTPDHSRRNFFGFVSGAFLLITSARNAVASPTPQQSSGTQQPPRSPMGNGGGGTGGGGGGIGGPSPSQKGGDYQPPTLSGSYDRKKDKDPAPKNARKDLVADQKTLRDDVQRLALDTQELRQAIAEFGPKQALSPDLVTKTKEIERLAHEIAELAKG
jgi:hypothetical protein